MRFVPSTMPSRTRMAQSAFALLVGACCLALSSLPSARADEGDDEVARVLALSPRRSTSVRGPNDGELVGGVAFPLRGPGFRHNPLRSRLARYGTIEVVQALVRAATRVHQELPGGELTVNDLGLREGGPIAHHASHQAGRDVDVLFYVTDPSGQPLPGVGAPLDPSGEGVDFRDLADPSDDVPLKLDVIRSWRFVEHLLGDETAIVQRIFLVEHLRTILLEHARRVGADPLMISRFEDTTCQPSTPHDDHFHFRFFCTPEDIRRGCEDSTPMYPWQRERLRAARVVSRRATPRPDRPRAPTVSTGQARREAGPMHESVQAWLDRREAWRRQPRTGRPYCR